MNPFFSSELQGLPSLPFRNQPSKATRAAAGTSTRSPVVASANNGAGNRVMVIGKHDIAQLNNMLSVVFNIRKYVVYF